MNIDELFEVVDNNRSLCGNVHNSDNSCEQVFHNEEKPKLLWYKVKPFSPLNDPQHGKSAHQKWLEVKPILEKIRLNLTSPEAIAGVVKERWEELYVTEWYKHLKDTPSYRELESIQRNIVFAYSENLIAAKKNINICEYGLVFKRGCRGNLINEQGLELLEPKVRAKILAGINHKDSENVLCHFEGYLCVVPKAWLRYPKK